MAKRKRKKLLSQERTDTAIYDGGGRRIIRFGLTKTEAEDDDGTEYYQTIAENLECGDGTVISPGHLLRPPSQGGVTLQRCRVCQRQSRRNRRIIPFSPSHQMRSCWHCRVRLCEKHMYIFDNHVVCGRCRLWQFLLHRILKPVFFRRIKDG